METKPLLYGLIGFMLGGLVVSIAATTINQPDTSHQEMTMSAMTATLKNKKGDAYDAAFIADMIDHHNAALDMAKLSATRSKHQEIKDLSLDIISAQQKEISQMRQWQHEWNYSQAASTSEHTTH